MSSFPVSSPLAGALVITAPAQLAHCIMGVAEAADTQPEDEVGGNYSCILNSVLQAAMTSLLRLASNKEWI